MGTKKRTKPAPDLDRVRLDDGEFALFCKACKKPVWHRGPIEWRGNEYCVEGPCDPCKHTVLFYTGQSDLPVWGAERLLKAAYAEIEEDDAPEDVAELLAEWLWENRDAITDLLPSLAETPVTLYEVKGMPEDDYLAVVGTKLSTIDDSDYASG